MGSLSSARAIRAGARRGAAAAESDGTTRQGPHPVPPSVAGLSIADWLIRLGFGAFLLAYLMGIGLSARGVLRWLFGA
jgi:hypothetical protein